MTGRSEWTWVPPDESDARYTATVTSEGLEYTVWYSGPGLGRPWTPGAGAKVAEQTVDVTCDVRAATRVRTILTATGALQSETAC